MPLYVFLLYVPLKYQLLGEAMLYCWFQVVTIDRERLISEKQNNKASPTGGRLPKEAMLLRDIFKFTKPSLDAFQRIDNTCHCSQMTCPTLLKQVFQLFTIIVKCSGGLVKKL